MNREITSKEEKLLTKGKETTIKTNIEHLKTYNEKIIKEKITSIGIYSNEISYFVKLENEDEILKLKEIFENKDLN